MFQSLLVINLFVSMQSAPVRVGSSPKEVNETDTPSVRSFISLLVKKHLVPLFRSPVVPCHRTRRRRGALPWLFSPPSVTVEPKRKLFFSAASRFFPTTPPPTPRSPLLLLLPSWPSCAPGAASTSSSCLMWGPRIMP